ncbi:MAG: GntR family transcriptional regulator [Acidobacteria bacterium]|nr:GntR family transcriptional regulator [Acidobacteriota bacterium]
MPKLKRLDREAAEDRTLSALRSAILAGTLSPGTRLRQEDLASQMGVSRMPIRQALLALEREGLVRTDRWRGTIVAPLDADLIRDMYAFRAVVERHVAETLARRPDFDSSTIRQVLTSGRKAIASGNVSRAIELDLRFHTMLYDSVGNQVLSSVMHGQWAHIRRVMSVTLTVPKLRERVWNEHTSILDAIDAHDGPRAGAEAEAHMHAASATLLEQLRAAAEGNVDSRTAAQAPTTLKSERARLRKSKTSTTARGKRRLVPNAQ